MAHNDNSAACKRDDRRSPNSPTVVGPFPWNGLAEQLKRKPLGDQIFAVIDRLGEATIPEVTEALATLGFTRRSPAVMLERFAALKRRRLLSVSGPSEAEGQPRYRTHPEALPAGEIRVRPVNGMVDVRLHARPSLLAANLEPTRSGFCIGPEAIPELVKALQKVAADIPSDAGAAGGVA